MSSAVELALGNPLVGKQKHMAVQKLVVNQNNMAVQKWVNTCFFYRLSVLSEQCHDDIMERPVDIPGEEGMFLKINNLIMISLEK